ncbi:MAG: iron-containing alcohol dehydrogenase [Clostridia bacterium]|nr:iron-containing alcohol dehydrogenase [Clostridia bacterium]
MPRGTRDPSATELQARASELVAQARGDRYSFGPRVNSSAGAQVAAEGQRALVIASQSRWNAPTLRSALGSLRSSRVIIAGGQVFRGARPGTPSEDVSRIASLIRGLRPDCIVAIGGGSIIDGAKAANIQAVGDQRMKQQSNAGLPSEGRPPIPLVAIQTAAGSASHLTNLAWVANTNGRSVRLISGSAVTPVRAVFDSTVTRTAPRGVVLDGAFYGVFRGIHAALCASDDHSAEALDGAGLVIELTLQNLPRVLADQEGDEAREAMAIATDLAGLLAISKHEGLPAAQAIWLALAQIPGHMRASAIIAPYLVGAFVNRAERRVRAIGEIYQRAGYIQKDMDGLSGRKLGAAVAGGMLRFMIGSGYPTSLPSVPGFSWLGIAGAMEAVTGWLQRSDDEALYADAGTARPRVGPWSASNTSARPWRSNAERAEILSAVQATFAAAMSGDVGVLTS